MGFWEYLLLGGALAAIVFGYLRLPNLLAYLVFLAVAIWPTYTLGAKNGWGVVTIVVIVAIIFVIYAFLYWGSSKIANRKAPR